jgi:hypothetical protein
MTLKKSTLNRPSSATPRPGRVTKEKAKETIRIATGASRATSRAIRHLASSVVSLSYATPGTGPSRESTPIPPSRHSSQRDVSEPRSGLSSSTIAHKNLMADIKSMVHESITEAFIARDRKIREEEVEPLPISGINPFSSAPTLPFATPGHVLSRWPWVTTETVRSIALGQFEIDSLPKLHHSDDLRNAYLKRSMKGIY